MASPSPAGPTRRTVLLAGPATFGLAALAGCTGTPAAPTASPTRSPARIDPDVALRAEAVARERALLQAYDAALAAVPSLSGLLLPLREEHTAHLAALGSPQPVPAGSAVPAPGPPAPGPQTRSAAAEAQLVGLRRAESTSALRHLSGIGPASNSLAALLATLAASEASHEVALT